MKNAFRFVLASLVALPLFADSARTTERTITKLADGVYAIRHVDPLPGWVHGNTTVIIGSREVFVVDSCQFPSAAREDIAQIRKWTDKPVRYLLNTHWHLDHAGGNAAYMEAFPGLAVIAHVETKRMLDDQVPQMVAQIGRDEGVAKNAALLADAKSFVYQPPTLTFRDALTIDLGGREVQVLHLGRGNTGGDAVVYLPKEKIVVTGDLVVHPVPFTFDGYPTEWAATLDKLAALDAETIVPGHGEVMHDKKYIIQLRDLMNAVVAQIHAQLHTNSEASLDEVKKGVNVQQQRDEILGGDTADAGFFNYALGSFIAYAYHEAKQR